MSGIICFLIANVSFIFFQDIRYYLLISILLIVISVPVYLSTKVYKKNHEKISIAGITLFICGAVIVYIFAFYLALSISFANSNPTIL